MFRFAATLIFVNCFSKFFLNQKPIFIIFSFLHSRSITPPTLWTKSEALFKNWLPMFGKPPTNLIVTNCWLCAKSMRIRNYPKSLKFPNLPVLPWKCWKMENSNQKIGQEMILASFNRKLFFDELFQYMYSRQSTPIIQLFWLLDRVSE